VTLVAAFRCRNNGVLLCADRKEDDGVANRPIDKIYRISWLNECEVFIAGSGTTTTVKDACAEIDQSFNKAINEGRKVLPEIRALIETSLKTVHSRSKEDLKSWPLYLIIVVAPRIPNVMPAIFRTDKSVLVPEGVYIAYGSGKTISDYLADHLYVHGLADDLLLILATFIFSEAEHSASGVGLGNDMVFILPGASLLKFMSTDSIKEIEATIPPLRNIVWESWRNQMKPPEWLKDYADSAESK
jgi:20S proteasome alpha/beta subunit